MSPGGGVERSRDKIIGAVFVDKTDNAYMLGLSKLKR